MKNKKIVWYIALIFLFSLIFSLLIPFGGDDWGNYLQKGSSVLEKINTAISYYFTFEGRFFSRLFLFFLMPHKVLLCVVKSALMSLLFYLMYKVLKAEDKYLPLILMGILFVDFQTYAQVYVWNTGFITYFFPIVFLFILIFIGQKQIDGELRFRFLNVLFIVLTFILSMFVENVTVGIIIVCLLNIVYYYLKNKKINILMLLCLIASVIGFCLMYFSPGTQARAASNTDFEALSVIGKFIYNIPNLVKYTYIKNSFLTGLLMIVSSVIVKRNIKNNFIKVLLLILIIIPAGLTMSINALSPFFEIPDILLKVLNSENVYIELYWIVFTLAFIFIIVRYSYVNNVILFFLILAILSAGAMMFSPVWGGRTACLTSYMLLMVLFLIIFKLDFKIFDNFKFNIFMNVTCALFMVSFTVYSIYIYNLNNERVKYINYQLENGAEQIEIIVLPGYYTWNLNTWGSTGDFAYAFKKAYGIDRDAELIYVYKDDIDLDV